MDDLSKKLSGILDDPKAMEEIAQLASSLGVDTSGVHKPEPSSAPDPDMMSMMSGLMPLMNTFKADDDTTRLLDAIRPFLSQERQEKLDRAKRLIRMMKLMPLLRELPLFDL